MATEAQRGELAALNKLVGINHLEARLKIKPRGKELHVHGHVTAEVVYTCVLTLEEFTSPVAEKVNATFAPSQQEGHKHKHVDLSYDIEPPEQLIDGEADIGALVQELFQLALDPYPHKPGAQFRSAGNDKK